MPKRNAEKNKISKNKRTRKEKPNVTELPFGFTEKFAEYDLLKRRHKLSSDGKMELKRLQDTYDSIQVCRRKKGLELLPEIDTLLNEFLIKKYSSSKDVPLPADPFPYSWSDDEPLPSIPPEIEVSESSSTGKSSITEGLEILHDSCGLIVDKTDMDNGEIANADSISAIAQDSSEKEEHLLNEIHDLTFPITISTYSFNSMFIFAITMPHLQ